MRNIFGKNKYGYSLNMRLEGIIIASVFVIVTVILGLLFRWFGG